MSGLSREEQRRLAEVERVASEAREIGNKALAVIAVHAAACTPIQEETKRRLGTIEDQNKWQTRYLIATLVGLLIAILMGVAQHKGLF